jgi:hypothetical protein
VSRHKAEGYINPQGDLKIGVGGDKKQAGDGKQEERVRIHFHVSISSIATHRFGRSGSVLNHVLPLFRNIRCFSFVK